MTSLRPLSDVAADLGLAPADVLPYGRAAAKLPLELLQRPRQRDGKARLVLVTAITPTPAGEGKTTTSIGLAQALRKAGEHVAVALREPSLGPCFGIKGGGTGGGASRLQPSARINLHFTGDFHAIGAAHNLLAATLDNELHFGNRRRIDVRRVLWPRVVDMNDRALRDITIGLGGKSGGLPRQTAFEITAASEVMAMLCLAEGMDDLRARLDRTLVAFDEGRAPVTAADLGVTGAMQALLADALLPNLAQTTEGVPAFVHGGPFANIAHGCNSVLATRMALHHADWVVTEAGFGADLGMEKFFDIKARLAGLDTACVVVVATVRALKMHGGVALKDLGEPDPSAVERGLANLEKHLENVALFGEKAVVAINHFPTDTAEEQAVILRRCADLDVPAAVARHFGEGGAGALELAERVLATAEWNGAPFSPVYPLDSSVEDKIRAVATQVYGADDIQLGPLAKRDLGLLRRLGLEQLPICVAKTQSSFSDDPKKLGRPQGFTLNVRRIRPNTGAGFNVVLTGDIVRMPGLPRVPAAVHVTVDEQGGIHGVE